MRKGNEVLFLTWTLCSVTAYRSKPTAQFIGGHWIFLPGRISPSVRT